MYGCIVALIYAGAVFAFGALIYEILISQRSRATVAERLGLSGFFWLAFVVGQGVVSAVWLALALAGMFFAELVWAFCGAGWLVAGALAVSRRGQLGGALKAGRALLVTLLSGRSWYPWLGLALALILALAGLMALLPSGVDDALRWYLVLPRTVAQQHKLELLPYLTPYYGLHPLQIEMHWAALFALANETAVTVWDFFCAASALVGIGILARTLTQSRRVAAVAVLVMLSSPGFFYLIGGGKPDNAAAQYGIAAFVLLAVWRELGRRAMVVAGFCVGWSLASRYTNVFLLPALILFPLIAAKRQAGARSGLALRLWARDLLLCASAVALTWTPMFFKNWWLLGCPFAPAYGCQNSAWSGVPWAKASIAVYNKQGLSLTDLLSYPVIWTFGYRPEMLGNISPLFVGLVPLLWLYRREPVVRIGWAAGWAGLLSVIVWWLMINGLFPYTRWVLVPLGLFAICLSTAVIAAEQDRVPHPAGRWLVRVGFLTTIGFLLFQSRGTVYAIRYAVGVDNRAGAYQSKPGYDVASWLNNNLRVGQRVAFAGWNGYAYFVRPEHLSHSESAAEFERLWNLCQCSAPVLWKTEFWEFYERAGFDYVIVTNHLVEASLSVLPANFRAEVVFAGRSDSVLKIPRSQQRVAG